MRTSRRSVVPLLVGVCAGLLVLSSGCSTSSNSRGLATPGTHRQTTPYRFGLSQRTYLWHVPAGYDASNPLPLVLVLHGAFSTAGKFEKSSGFSQLADREGFVVAYPNGIGVLGWLQHWNAGHCCGLAQKEHVDDVGFLNYVIDDVARRVPIDPQRLYVVGHSNGGMLAYQFASENSAKIAAVCVVSGSIGSARGRGHAPCQTGPPQMAVPLLALHGRQDQTVPFAGGLGRRSGGRYYVSVFDSVSLWARYCRCDSPPQVSADPHGGPSTLIWCDARGVPWVSLYILDHWQHAWPGTFHRTRLPPEHPLGTFEAAEVIWDFFRSHTRGGPLPE